MSSFSRPVVTLLSALTFTTLAFDRSAAAPQSGEHVMIVIATSGPPNAGTGVSMIRQFFPSADSCDKAMKIVQGDIPGGTVTARCYPTR